MIQNETLAAQLSAANEDTLTALANKGLYKRALKDIEGLTAEYTEVDDTIQITVGGEQCVIRFPFEKSTCSCPSRTVCRHILGAILLLKKEVPEGLAKPQTEEPQAPEPSKEPMVTEPSKESPKEMPSGKAVDEALTPDDISEIKSCAKHSLSLLGTLLARGLVRADSSVADALELAAVSAHTAKMADAERKLRALSGRLSDCINRRASFDAQAFTRLICACASTLAELESDDVTCEKLGVFRDTYELYPGELELLPIGQREVVRGEYQGNVYYFLNLDENEQPRFLMYSDLRPTFYSQDPHKRAVQTVIWGLNIPLVKMMYSKLVLKNAKLSGEKISGSSETKVALTSKAELNCPQLRKLVITDFRELAYYAGTKKDRLFLIRIHRLEDYGFDKHTQIFSMVISDRDERTVTAEVKYFAENKEFVEKIEEICGRINDTVDVWTMLVSARIKNGVITLNPIEFYDFIEDMDFHSFSPPSETSTIAPQYAHVLLNLLSEVENSVVRCVRSGLSSTVENHTPLLENIKRCGMSGLAALAEDFFSSTDSYRNRFDQDAEKSLSYASKLMKYIILAENKLGRISALHNMNNIEKEE
ncbi:MAG: SWIM zinc finger family protein [Paludibacteraceae bacterium]|nr:SWIM zinc finger family protein [Paludibacteraceae bacterium]